MQVAIPIFDGLTALDAVGPYEVLTRLPGAQATFVAIEPGPKRTEDGVLALVADASLDDVPRPEIIVVPGGKGSRAPGQEPLVDWIRRAHETSQWTTSVCTGALLLGRAGLLRGLPATTHWMFYDQLRELGAEPTSQRVVRAGKIVTAAGVSSGIDMALELAGAIAGEEVGRAIQLSIEYDPQPPFDAGSPAKAGEKTAAMVRLAAARGEM